MYLRIFRNKSFPLNKISYIITRTTGVYKFVMFGHRYLLRIFYYFSCLFLHGKFRRRVENLRHRYVSVSVWESDRFRLFFSFFFPRTSDYVLYNITYRTHTHTHIHTNIHIYKLAISVFFRWRRNVLDIRCMSPMRRTITFFFCQQVFYFIFHSVFLRPSACDRLTCWRVFGDWRGLRVREITIITIHNQKSYFGY